MNQMERRAIRLNGAELDEGRPPEYPSLVDESMTD
jgi:hypothetical protein